MVAVFRLVRFCSISAGLLLLSAFFFFFTEEVIIFIPSRDSSPLGGGLNIPYPCTFLTKYPVSHKFRLQISRKLKYRPFSSHVTCYDVFYNIRSLALKRKLEKYRFQVAYCDSFLNCCHSKYDGTFQVES